MTMNLLHPFQSAPAMAGIPDRTDEPLLLVLGIYLLMSIITFFTYAADKRAAQKSRWRIPELHLHLLSLFGGWPGAMCARHLFRHKTIKRPFRLVFWLTVILNGAALIWLLTTAGLA